MLYIKAKFACFLSDDFKVGRGIIRFIINGDKGDTALVFRNDGIDGNDTCTARLAATFGSDSHTYFTDVGCKFHPLKWILFQAFQEFFVIVRQAPMTLGKMFDGNIKVFVPKDFVAHLSIRLLVGMSWCLCRRGSFSNLPILGKSLPLCRVWVLPRLLLIQALNGNAHGVISESHVPHGQPCRNTWTGWRETLLYLQWS